MNSLNDNISPQEKQNLDKWLAESDEHQNQYNLISKIVAAGQHMEFPDDPDVNSAWNSFEFPQDPLPEPSLSARFGNWLSASTSNILQPRRLAFATAVILVVAVFSTWYYHSMHELLKISTGNTQIRQVTLSDGTRIWLNSGTELSYPRSFREKTRHVTVTGEAFFDVAKTSTPFIVRTDRGTIKVLGTRFNVWSREQATRVIVEAGRVKFSSIDDSSSAVILTTGFMSTLAHSNTPSVPEQVSTAQLLGWRQGKLVFERTCLPEILAELERYYDVPIHVDNRALNHKSLTATFDRLPIEKVLYSICQSLDVRYKNVDGVYVIYKADNEAAQP